MGSQPVEQGEPVHPGEHQIHHGAGVLRVQSEVQTSLAIASAVRFVPGSLVFQGYCSGDLGVIFDDENKHVRHCSTEVV